MPNTQPQVPILLDIEDGIACLTFQRPEVNNTIDLPFGQALLAASRRIASAGVGAVVMTGAGKNFCLGGDLKAMLASGQDVEAYLRELTVALHEAILNLVRCRAPLIAAVNGTAAGAGLGLVLAADMAIAAQSAKFISAYTAVGLTPDAGSTYTLPRIVGRARASEFFLTNRLLDANTALSWGMVCEVVPDAALLGTARERAAKLAAGPIEAFGATKRLLEQSLPGFAEQLERESLSIAARGKSAEGQEGIQAFTQKRPPAFKPAPR